MEVIKTVTLSADRAGRAGAAAHEDPVTRPGEADMSST